MISTSYDGSPRSLLASVNTSAGPTTSSIRAGGTAIIATRLRRATFAGLPPPFFRCLAGIVAEKVGFAPINIISKYGPRLRNRWSPLPEYTHVKFKGLWLTDLD